MGVIHYLLEIPKAVFIQAEDFTLCPFELIVWAPF